MKRWFGPKLLGIGASPASWEGWLLTGLLVAGVLGLTKVPGVTETGMLAGTGVLLTLYLLVVVATYGLRPEAARGESDWGRLVALWTAYLLAMVGLAAWVWTQPGGDASLPIHWDAAGRADNFAAAEWVLPVLPGLAVAAMAAIAFVTRGRKGSSAWAASVAVLSLLLLAQAAYVAAVLGEVAAIIRPLAAS